MLLRELTTFDVKTVCAHLQETLSFKVHDKRSSEIMEIVGDVLEALRITTSQAFRENYCTTLFDHVYLNFVPGEVCDTPFADQIAMIVHEATHVMQYRAGFFQFASGYLASSAERARVEEAAYAAQSTMMFVCYNEVLLPEFLKDAMQKGYGISPEHAQMASDMLRSTNDVIRRGAHIGSVAHTAIVKMQEMGLLPA